MVVFPSRTIYHFIKYTDEYSHPLEHTQRAEMSSEIGDVLAPNIYLTYTHYKKTPIK